MANTEDWVERLVTRLRASAHVERIAAYKARAMSPDRLRGLGAADAYDEAAARVEWALRAAKRKQRGLENKENLARLRKLVPVPSLAEKQKAPRKDTDGLRGNRRKR